MRMSKYKISLVKLFTVSYKPLGIYCKPACSTVYMGCSTDVPSFVKWLMDVIGIWIQIRVQIVSLGFGVLRLAQHKKGEGGGPRAYLEDARRRQRAGRRPGAAARPVVAAAREGRKSKGGERESPREGKKETKGGDR